VRIETTSAQFESPPDAAPSLSNRMPITTYFMAVHLMVQRRFSAVHAPEFS
jgi:hypothetical protein